MSYEPVIGIEAHIELCTNSKMFCGCKVVDSTNTSPNQFVCPICAGFPGTLPIINQKAVEYAILISLALNCTINSHSCFSRKNYFYPDLPKGYQISQHHQPLANNGYLTIISNSTTKKIRIQSVHLEEDAGKLIHQNAVSTLVDLNRSGIPLVEVITEPDLSNATEAVSYAKELHSILSYLKVTSGGMEKGVLRFEANVSVKLKDHKTLGVRREIKNLNSFKALQHSIEYEIQQQIQSCRSGETIVQQTLGWNEKTKQTILQRNKEDKEDYRYFPEPDLPNLIIDTQWIDDTQNSIPELPYNKRKRFQSLGLSAHNSYLLAKKEVTSTFFDKAVKLGSNNQPEIKPDMITKWITVHLFKLLNEFNVSIDKTNISPGRLIDLLALVSTGLININSAKLVLREIYLSSDDPTTIVNNLNLKQALNNTTLSDVIDTIIENNPDQIQKLLEGKISVFNWLFGQIMRTTNNTSNPKEVKTILKSAIDKKRHQGKFNG